MRGHPDLNRGPLDLQSNALPLSYTPTYWPKCRRPINYSRVNQLSFEKQRCAHWCSSCFGGVSNSYTPLFCVKIERGRWDVVNYHINTHLYKPFPFSNLRFLQQLMSTSQKKAICNSTEALERSSLLLICCFTCIRLRKFKYGYRTVMTCEVFHHTRNGTLK